MTTQPIITSSTLKEWDACMDGYYRFCELFPDGADLDTAVYGLIQDKKISWAFWLINKAQKYDFCAVNALLVELSQHNNDYVRMWTAENLNTPPEVLKSLSKDNDAAVRIWTAKNPNTPLEVLKSLSKDNDASVRRYANETLQKGSNNMSKRMIDTDSLLSEFKNIIKRGTYNIMGVDYNIDVPVFINILHKIEDLANPVPEPQESIFDADGWCWDMSLLKIGESVLLFNDQEGLSVGFRDTVGVYADADMINLTEEYQKSERLNKRIQGYVIEWQAWRPLPNLPKKP